MARMFPPEIPALIRYDPGRQAECLVYDILRDRLDEPYTAFHGLSWLARRKHGRVRSGEIDFILFHPGHGLLCVEVKGGEISRDGRTGNWYSRDRRGRKHRIADPVRQAREARFALIDRLREHSDWPGHRIRIGYAVAFPDCECDPGPDLAELPGDLILRAGNMSDITGAVERAFDFWREAEPDSVNPESEDAERLESILSPTFHLPRPLGVDLRNDDREIVRLTGEQLVVLEFLERNERVDVSGGAGTGKTFLAIQKARILAGKGVRTLLTCFNRPLAEMMRREAGEVPGLTVTHFHRLCFDEATAAGVPLLSPDGAVPPPEYFDRVMPEALAESFRRRPGRRFDALIVDEAQDFAPSWWPSVLAGLDDPERSTVYLFRDGNQSIYSARNGRPEGLVPILLTRNLRNTRAIHKLASEFYTGDPFRSAGPPGRDVEFHAADPGPPAEEVLGNVLNRFLVTEKLPVGDLVVLSGHRRANSPVGEDGLLGGFPCTEDPEAEPGHVLFQSIHRFKGLERPVVILVELEDRLKDEELIYVGITRARAHLVVIGSGETLQRLRG